MIHFPSAPIVLLIIPAGFNMVDILVTINYQLSFLIIFIAYLCAIC